MEKKCWECGAALIIDAGQTLIDGKIYWHVSTMCSSCNLRIEEDGVEDMPDEYRRIVLKKEGEWRLKILEAPRKISNVLKVIRETLQLSMAETAKVKKQIPGTIFCGTIAEVKRLRENLNELCLMEMERKY